MGKSVYLPVFVNSWQMHRQRLGAVAVTYILIFMMENPPRIAWAPSWQVSIHYKLLIDSFRMYEKILSLTMQSVTVGVWFVPLKAHLWNLNTQYRDLRTGTS